MDLYTELYIPIKKADDGGIQIDTWPFHGKGQAAYTRKGLNAAIAGNRRWNADIEENFDVTNNVLVITGRRMITPLGSGLGSEPERREICRFKKVTLTIADLGL